MGKRVPRTGLKDGDMVQIGSKNVRPSNKHIIDVKNSPEAQNTMAKVVNSIRLVKFRAKPKSNAELQERIDEYLGGISERGYPPTVEEMSLYCGVTSRIMQDWKRGEFCPYHDDENGTTQDIMRYAFEALHAVDAVLAETGQINAVTYIFRSKNRYGMTDNHTVEVQTEQGKAALTRGQLEEIAANLPDGNIDVDGTVH